MINDSSFQNLASPKAPSFLVHRCQQHPYLPERIEFLNWCQSCAIVREPSNRIDKLQIMTQYRLEVRSGLVHWHVCLCYLVCFCVEYGQLIWDLVLGYSSKDVDVAVREEDRLVALEWGGRAGVWGDDVLPEVVFRGVLLYEAVWVAADGVELEVADG